MGGRLYLAAVGSILTLVGVVLAASGTQGPPVYVSSGGAPSGACSGERVWMTKANPSDTWCCISSAWVRCGVGTANPIPNCAPGEFVTADGGGFICKSLSLVETDPKSIHVGTTPLCPTTYFLTGDDAGFSCEQEVDPKIYAQSGPGLFCKGDGTGVECEYTAVEVEVDPRLPHCPWGYTAHTTDDAGTWGCSKDVPPAYGELYEEHTSTTITLTTQNAYYQWVSSTVGECYGMTCSTSTDSLTITQDGVYRIVFETSISINATNQIVEAAIFAQNSGCDAGGCEIEKCTASQRLTTAGDEKSMTGACLLDLKEGDILTLRFANYTSGSDTITIEHISMSAANISPTVAVAEFTGNYVASLATTGPLSGGASPSQGSVLTLGLNDCGNGKILASYDGGWNCVDFPSESDPLSYLRGTFPLCPTGYVLKNSDGGVTCTPNVALAGGITASCGSGQFLKATDAGTSCATESDPSLPVYGCTDGIPLVYSSQWTCGYPYVRSDLLTETQGNVISYVADAGSWLSTPESDPQVGAVTTSGLWCTADGTKVNCASQGIPQNCSTGQRPFWSGSSWVCYGTHYLLADVEEQTTNWTDVTGLNVTAGASSWLAVDCALAYDVGNSGIGIALGLNGPSGSSASYETWVFHNANIDTSQHGTADFCNSNSLASGSSGCSATTSTTTDSVVYRAGLRGTIKLGASSGTVVLRARGNAADAFWRIKSGSWCRFDFIY